MALVLEAFNDPTAPVQPNQYAYEFGELLRIYTQRAPKRVLEIGSAQGGSLFQWLKHARRGAQVVAIDLPGAMHGIPGTGEWAQHWPGWAERFGVELAFMLADSRHADAFEFAKQYGPFDWVFIDGDHTYGGVLSDWLTYSPLVADGGVVVFHDILPHRELPSVEVDKLWADLQLSYPTAEFISAQGQPDKGIGVVYV